MNTIVGRVQLRVPPQLKSKWCRLFLDSPQAKLQRLNEIVWPEIWRLAEEKIRQAHAEGYRVCIIDAAVLLKAGWDRHVHEVWVAIAPEKEVRDATCGCSLCTEYHVCCYLPKEGLSRESHILDQILKQLHTCAYVKK